MSGFGFRDLRLVWTSYRGSDWLNDHKVIVYTRQIPKLFPADVACFCCSVKIFALPLVINGTRWLRNKRSWPECRVAKNMTRTEFWYQPRTSSHVMLLLTDGSPSPVIKRQIQPPRRRSQSHSASHCPAEDRTFCVSRDLERTSLSARHVTQPRHHRVAQAAEEAGFPLRARTHQQLRAPGKKWRHADRESRRAAGSAWRWRAPRPGLEPEPLPAVRRWSASAPRGRPLPAKRTPAAAQRCNVAPPSWSQSTKDKLYIERDCVSSTTWAVQKPYTSAFRIIWVPTL